MRTFRIFSSAALLAAALISQASAYFYTTTPVTDQSWTPGTQYTVTWIPQPADGEAVPAPSDTYIVKLRTGGNFDMETVTQLTPSPLSVGTTTFSFTLPGNLNPGAYFLEYTSSNGLANWTGRFTVGGSTNWYPELPATETSTAVPTSEPTTSVTPTVSASESASESASDSTATTTTDNVTESATVSASYSVSAPSSDPTPPPKCRSRRRKNVKL
ncbi:hypothetical protein IWQ60_005402 [Tieghemiomyces parasiticus]|uniref:Yeast cell wall synthesis Kre9/Knh1-like N-terminal domain-containing protein n=1 Tax=Tieghemiomyces parasiticus TaxID=78921 RepID=A0A9W8A6G4_9FUNG|nr:hypothetical protein IWQ60_005402 [Tieghemiomyces parasiticus]